MRRLILALSIACLLASIPLAFAQQLPPAPQSTFHVTANTYTLTLKLIEKHGNETKTLVSPTITAIAERPFAFVAGGEIPNVSPTLTYGTSINGTIGKRVATRIPVVLAVSIGDVLKMVDPSIKGTKARSIDLRMDLEYSTTKTIQIDDVTWCEIRID